MQGRRYCDELLQPDSAIRFHETTRMDVPCFRLLHELLVTNGLTSKRFVRSDEKLIMFLYLLSRKEYRCIAIPTFFMYSECMYS